MFYTVWETTTANLIESYDNLHDALALVLEGIARNGPRDTETLSLSVQDDAGHVRPVAAGPALADLARRELGVVVDVEH